MSAIKNNPFKPNSPVNPGMFAGRLRQINKLETSLFQTKAGHPINSLITGERGIGKTSHLNYFKYLATGMIKLEGHQFKFLVIEIDIDQNMTQYSLIKKIELGLQKELGQTEKARAFLKTAWSFIQRIEACSIAVKEKETNEDRIVLSENFAYSLSDTINRLTEESNGESIFSAVYDGIILLIDEADKCSSEVDLGTFLKMLLERLQKRGCEKFSIALAGLPDVRNVLHNSHPSSLRMFEEIPVDRLTDDEVRYVIDICLEEANKINEAKTTVTQEGKTLLTQLSEGYPHFIQQFGYSAFEYGVDGTIDAADVRKSAFGKRGALNIIGDRYYRNDFYNKIEQDSYRQVLRIMSEKLDDWITKKEIKNKYNGKSQTLDNAINALRRRHIILSAEGKPGTYRLQHKGFALWISLYTTGDVLTPEKESGHTFGHEDETTIEE